VIAPGETKRRLREHGPIQSGPCSSRSSTNDAADPTQEARDVGMEHPFLVIKVPDANNYPDQEFHP
jgi:hypothetical protein